MSLADLQYVAAVLGVMGIGTLNFWPRHVRKGLVISILCSMAWIGYGLHVNEHMVALTQSVYLVFSSIGLYRRSKIKL